MQRPKWLGAWPLAALGTVSAIGLTVPATAAASPLNPASPQARLLSDLFWITLGIALIVFVAVEFLIIYTALRFRKPRGVTLPEPQQITGNTRLEILWTVLPAVLLAVLFVLSVRGMALLGTLPADA